MNPLVSVLIPVYNTEKYLPACLESIAGQTYPNLQVVVVDDGSKDASLSIAQEYAAKHPFIEVYHQENAGVAAARNNLLSHVKGEYVLFVDSDDWIEPDMVDFLVKKAKEYKVDMVTCGRVVNDDLPKVECSIVELWNQEHVIKEFLRHVSFNGSLWNKLIRVDLLHDVKFHFGISYGEDALFVWNVLQHVKQVLVTDKELYHYQMNEGSISHANWSPYKMGTGHSVWEKIEKDVSYLWPQYQKIVSTTFVISDMWQLYYALLSNYPYDDYMKLYQKHLKEDINLIRKSKDISINKKIFAEVVSRNYTIGKILVKMSHL